MQDAANQDRVQPRHRDPVLRPSDATNHAGQDTGRDTLSHTLLTTFLACPQRFDFRYQQRLEAVSRRDALTLGSAFQYGIEHRDPAAGAAQLREHAKTPNDQKAEDKLQADETIVKAAATYYLRRWPPDATEARELEYRVRLRSPWTGAYSQTFDLLGYADGVIDVGDHLELIENKLVGQLTEQGIKRLKLDRQISLACYGLWRATGKPVRVVHYRMTRKPSIKQRQGERIDEFVDRLEADYADPERQAFYGHAESLFRGTDDQLRVEQELWEWARQLRDQRRQRLFPRNTSACLDFGGCEFLPKCLGDPDAHALYRVRPPHARTTTPAQEAA